MWNTERNFWNYICVYIYIYIYIFVCLKHGTWNAASQLLERKTSVSERSAIRCAMASTAEIIVQNAPRTHFEKVEQEDARGAHSVNQESSDKN